MVPLPLAPGSDVPVVPTGELPSADPSVDPPALLGFNLGDELLDLRDRLLDTEVGDLLTDPIATIGGADCAWCAYGKPAAAGAGLGALGAYAMGGSLPKGALVGAAMGLTIALLVR